MYGSVWRDRPQFGFRFEAPGLAENTHSGFLVLLLSWFVWFVSWYPSSRNKCYPRSRDMTSLSRLAERWVAYRRPTSLGSNQRRHYGSRGLDSGVWYQQIRYSEAESSRNFQEFWKFRFFSLGRTGSNHCALSPYVFGDLVRVRERDAEFEPIEKHEVRHCPRERAHEERRVSNNREEPQRVRRASLCLCGSASSQTAISPGSSASSVRYMPTYIEVAGERREQTRG